MDTINYTILPIRHRKSSAHSKAPKRTLSTELYLDETETFSHQPYVESGSEPESDMAQFQSNKDKPRTFGQVNTGHDAVDRQAADHPGPSGRDDSKPSPDSNPRLRGTRLHHDPLSEEESNVASSASHASATPSPESYSIGNGYNSDSEDQNTIANSTSDSLTLNNLRAYTVPGSAGKVMELFLPDNYQPRKFVATETVTYAVGTNLEGCVRARVASVGISRFHSRIIDLLGKGLPHWDTNALDKHSTNTLHDDLVVLDQYTLSATNLLMAMNRFCSLGVSRGLVVTPLNIYNIDDVAMLCRETFWALMRTFTTIHHDSILAFNSSIFSAPEFSTLSKSQATATRKLEAISSTLSGFMSEFEELTFHPSNDEKTQDVEYKKFREGILVQVLLELETVETEMDEELEEIRKRLVKEAQQVLSRLDEIWHDRSDENGQWADHDRFYRTTILDIYAWNRDFDEACNKLRNRFLWEPVILRHTRVQEWDAGYNGVITAEHWMTAQGIKR